MTTDKLKSMYAAVCNAPGGNGFRVEHMPEMFQHSEVDDCRAHVHAFYEILWFQEGEGQHTVDFTTYDVRPGTLFFLAPGQIHHFDHREGYRGTAIKMCTDLLKDGNSNPFLKYNTFHNTTSTPYYIIDPETERLLLPLVQQMEQEAERNGLFGNTDVLKALLTLFLVTIQRHARHASAAPLDTLRPSSQVYIQFRQMVEQEYAALHTVQEYADRLNVALRTLHKSVHACSGKTPLAIINERILLEAKRMIRYTNLMIKEIASDLGYEDPSYFVKLFKRQTGHLPSDFREMETNSQTDTPPDSLQTKNQR